jgi:serine/threonine-protein kinase
MDGTTDEAGEFASGDLVGAYRIAARIGSGGMGAVYRAAHVLRDRTVALKILHSDQLEYARSIDRMMREASILASVQHAGIPRFYECGMLDDRRTWIAMELVEGLPLHRRLHDGVMEPGRVSELIAHVADVLAHAHAAGITHRDLKPDNIVLTHGRFPVSLLDWGIAHHQHGARYTNVNEAIGTPTYMAPEQARGAPTDGRADVYGLGVVAYRALVGRAPFVGQTAIEILVQHLSKPIPPLAPRCPDAPMSLVELVERMLAKDPEVRPTAAEVCADAARIQRAGEASPYQSIVVDEVEDVPTRQLRR